MLLVCSAKLNADVPATRLRGDWWVDANYPRDHLSLENGLSKKPCLL